MRFISKTSLILSIIAYALMFCIARTDAATLWGPWTRWAWAWLNGFIVLVWIGWVYQKYPWIRKYLN